MSIPEDKILEIRDATDIIEVISQHVTLKKRGKTFVGLCPFHNEKTPSFHVDSVRGFYHCFGCDAGGNVFSFVMQMERIGFPEAVKLLAEKAGISLPDQTYNYNQSKGIEELYRVNRLAADFFREIFLKTDEGKQAQVYFYSKRKFNPIIAERFQIGWAPNAWDGLLKKASSMSIKEEILLKAGLIVSRKDGSGYYDRFRGRLIFPIHNPSGQVVGFGGRILRDDPNSPKYINSPETAVYQKGRILYGLYESKNGIQRNDNVILVEGYTDLIRMVMCGMDYTVATSGTALTEGQAALISRYSKHVILVFDGDSAGFNAALRGIDILVGAGLSVRIAPLPKGTDPDTYLLQYGNSEMEKHIRSSKQLIDFYIDQTHDKGKLGTLSDRADLARSILSVVSKVKDPIERNLMIKETGEKLGLDEGLLLRQLIPDLSVQSSSNKIVLKNLSARMEAEEGILLLLMDDCLKWSSFVFRYLNPCHFHQKEIQLVIKDIHNAVIQKINPTAEQILDRYQDKQDIVRFLSRLISMGFEKQVNPYQSGLDWVIRLRQDEVQNQIDQTRREIQIGETQGKDVSCLNQEYIDLKNQWSKLRAEIAEDWKKHVENV